MLVAQHAVWQLKCRWCIGNWVCTVYHFVLHLMPVTLDTHCSGRHDMFWDCSELHRQTSTFMLRRTQAVLSKHLPPLTVHTIFCKPSPLQASRNGVLALRSSGLPVLSDTVLHSSCTTAVLQSVPDLPEQQHYFRCTQFSATAGSCSLAWRGSYGPVYKQLCGLQCNSGHHHLM